MKKHHLIFVPGLGDNVPPFTWAVNRFKSDIFIPHIHEAPWRPPGEGFKPKLERLLSLIDQLSKDGQVSLIGISAGGSLVLNAYLQRKNQITKVVNIAGRLRAGGIPSLDFASRIIPAFRKSVLMFEENEQNLTKTDRNKILTIRGIFDELVPPQTTILKGAINIQLPLVEHNIIIYSALIFYKKKISTFLRNH